MLCVVAAGPVSSATIEASDQIWDILWYNLILVYKSKSIWKAKNVKNVVEADFYIENYY